MSTLSIAGSAFRPLREEISEQRVLRLGLALAAAYLVAAVVAFALPGVRSGHWAGTHLAFAGAALVAIGAFMPHFGATLAGSRPASAAVRLGAILALAAGARHRALLGRCTDFGAAAVPGAARARAGDQRDLTGGSTGWAVLSWP